MRDTALEAWEEPDCVLPHSGLVAFPSFVCWYIRSDRLTSLCVCAAGLDCMECDRMAALQDMVCVHKRLREHRMLVSCKLCQTLIRNMLTHVFWVGGMDGERVRVHV